MVLSVREHGIYSVMTKSLKLIAILFQDNNTLAHLNLSHNDLGDPTGMALGPAIGKKEWFLSELGCHDDPFWQYQSHSEHT